MYYQTQIGDAARREYAWKIYKERVYDFEAEVERLRHEANERANELQEQVLIMHHIILYTQFLFILNNYFSDIV